MYFSADGSMVSLTSGIPLDTLHPDLDDWRFEWWIDSVKYNSTYDFIHAFGSNSDYLGRDYRVCLVLETPLGCSDTICEDVNNNYFSSLFLPNAFTPEYNDGEAQVFLPKGKSLVLYDISVYDKWGNLLWRSDLLDEDGSPVESWNGTYKDEDKLVPSGVYYYVVNKAIFSNGESWPGKRRGTITIMFLREYSGKCSGYIFCFFISKYLYKSSIRRISSLS